ncbi:MAG: hypothetical protein FJ039_10385 [Chloroflexi bacterium]|nr:hypothetical protein [Chloroflexota bacterium]
MIIVRRILAVLLAVIFIALFTVSLVLSRVNGTIGSPDFISKQLRDANVYTWIYDDLAPAAIEEAQTDNADLKIDLTKISPDLIAVTRALLPPDWLRQYTEETLDQTIPYFFGREDHFEIVVPLKDRLRDSIPTVKAALKSDRIAAAIYDDVVTDMVDEALKDKTIPFGLTFTTAEIVETIKKIAPPDYVQGQMANAADAVFPYLAGDKETFVVRVDLSSRADPAAREVKALIAKKDLTTFVFDQVIAPTVRSSIGTNLRVPFNLVVTSADVDRIIRETLPRDWVQLQVNNLVDESVNYLVGKKPSFSLTIPLADRQQAALDSVGRLMDQKLADAYTSARLCTAQEIATLNPLTFVNTGIPCRYPNFSIEQVKALAGLVNYQAEVARIVDNALPNSYVFSEADLRRAFGADQSQQFDDLRRYLTTGVDFDQADFEEIIAKDDYTGRTPWDQLSAAAKKQEVERSETVKDFRKLRDRIKRNFTYTDADYRRFLDDRTNADFTSSDLDDARDALGMIGLWKWIFLGSLVILVLVGLLGGRRNWSKMLWSASVLFVAALLILIAAKPIWNAQAGDRAARELQEEIDKSDTTKLERVIMTKGKEIAVSSLDDAGGKVVLVGVLSLVISVAAGTAALVVLQRRDRPKGPKPPEASPAAK